MAACHANVPAVEAVEIAWKAHVLSSMSGDSHRSQSAATTDSYSRVCDQPVTAAVTR
jgi:hypothetical protein